MKIADKLLYADDIKIYDIVGNKVNMSMNSGNSLEYIFATINGTDIYYPTKKLDYKKFSIIVSQESGLLFRNVEEILLNNMRNIEFLYFQYLNRRKMNDEDYNLWCDYLDIVEFVKMGQINGTEYEKEIFELKKKNEKVFNSIQFIGNIRFLNQLMLDEFKHGELRLIDCFNSQLDNIQEVIQEKKIELNSEYLSLSVYADNSGFCIQDSIKAIYKQLDILSKIMFYTKDLDNIKKQIPERHFENIIQVINSWKESNEKRHSIELFNELKIFRSIRNEVTHNTSFHTIRQPVFVGNGTECINNIPLLYSDIMFWDYCGNMVERSNGRVGFYKNKKNALSEMQKHFINAIKLNYNCLLYQYKVLTNKFLECNIQSVCIWKEVDGTLGRFEVDSIDLMKQFKNINFEG